MKSLLSEHLLKKAFISNGGELAWKKEDVPRVIDEYLRLEVPVYGFEVWIIEEETKTVRPIWTSKIDNKEYVAAYAISEKKDTESNLQYCERAKKEILDIITKWDIEHTVIDNAADKVRYNFTVEEEY